MHGYIVPVLVDLVFLSYDKQLMLHQQLIMVGDSTKSVICVVEQLILVVRGCVIQLYSLMHCSEVKVISFRSWIYCYIKIIIHEGLMSEFTHIVVLNIARILV